VVATLVQEDPSFMRTLICNSSLVYFVNLTNFQVIKHTSPLTVQVMYHMSFETFRLPGLNK
jgi:hypothetical protein